LFLLGPISVLIALLPILPLQGRPPGGTHTSYSDSRQATSKSAQIAQKAILTGGAVRPVLGHGPEIPRYRTALRSAESPTHHPVLLELAGRLCSLPRAPTSMQRSRHRVTAQIYTSEVP